MGKQATMALLCCSSDHGHIRESHHHLCWKRPPRLSLTFNRSPPCQQIMTFSNFLNISRGGDSTTFLGSLFQCLTTLSTVVPSQILPDV